MGNVIMLSGPIGAGKTTVARKLIPILPGSIAYIEGDTFWSFIAKSEQLGHRENFRVIMRAMTAAAIPFARSGYDVLIDFSVPPDFLDTARKILKEVPLDFVVLLPSLAVCQERSAGRAEGAIVDYSPYASFYSLFGTASRFNICNDEADAERVAMQIREGLAAGTFRVS